MAAQWIGDNKKEEAIVYGDRFMWYALVSYGGIEGSFSVFDPHETTISKGLYLPETF